MERSSKEQPATAKVHQLLGQMKVHVDLANLHNGKAEAIRQKVVRMLPPDHPLLDLLKIKH